MSLLASASAAVCGEEAETDSPMQVRDQHYDFDFDSEDGEQQQQSPAAAVLPSIRQPLSGSRSSPLLSASPPPIRPSPLPRNNKTASEQEEYKEHLHSSPSPHHDSPSPLISATAGDSRQERQPSPPVRRMTANGTVLSSAALQSLSALKQRRRTRAASAVEGRPRRDSGGDADSRGSIRGGAAPHHSYSGSHHFTGSRDDDDNDDDDEAAEESRRTHEQRRRRQHITDQEEAQERRDRSDAEADDDSTQPAQLRDDDEERLPPLHSSTPSPHVLSMSRQSSRHASLLYAATPSPTPSVPLILPSAASRPRTRAASAFPALSSHSTSASSLSSTSTLSQPEVTFTASESLHAMEQPGSALSHLPRQLQSSDWSSRFEALTCLRRLLLHHPQLLSAAALKPLLRDVRSEVDSLRSLLAKNAISCLCLLFTSLPRLAEAELPLLLPPLLKRAGETSGAFLAEEAERALAVMADRCCEAKTLPALVSCAEKGNKVVRMQAVQWLGKAVEMRGGREMTDGSGAAAAAGDVAKVLKALGVGCGEAGASVRGWCKRGLQRLGAELGWEELEQALRRVLSSSQMAVVKKLVLDRRGEAGAEPEGKSVSFSVAKRAVKGRAELEGSPLSISGSSAFEYPKEIDTSFCLDSTASSLSPRSSSSSASSSCTSGSSPCKPSILKRRSTLTSTAAGPSARSRVSSADGAAVAPPAELLPSIVADMTSTDWRTRLHSIESLTAFCSSFSLPAASAAAALLVDPLFSLIQDNNGKVIIAAMQSLPQLLPTLLPLLPIQPLLLRLTANLASSNITVRSLASSVLDTLPALCEDGRGGLLMQPYCQCLLYGNVKIKLLVLEKIVELVARGPAATAAMRAGGKGREKATTVARGSASVPACPSPTSLSVTHLKWAIPVCFLWADESRAEMKALLQKLTMLVYAQMGSDMFDAQLMLSLKLSTAAVRKMQAMLDIH